MSVTDGVECGLDRVIRTNYIQTIIVDCSDIDSIRGFLSGIELTRTSVFKFEDVGPSYYVNFYLTDKQIGEQVLELKTNSFNFKKINVKIE
jgi:hypothetical protein